MLFAPETTIERIDRSIAAAQDILSSCEDPTARIHARTILHELTSLKESMASMPQATYRTV